MWILHFCKINGQTIVIYAKSTNKSVIKMKSTSIILYVCFISYIKFENLGYSLIFLPKQFSYFKIMILIASIIQKIASNIDWLIYWFIDKSINCIKYWLIDCQWVNELSMSQLVNELTSSIYYRHEIKLCN